jgi:hypothetical protein
MKKKVVTILFSLAMLFGIGVVAAPAAQATTLNSGLGYTQYWVYRDYCPAGQVWIHRAWYVRTDYNAWYETLYGLRDYDRYDHTDYYVAKYVWPC